ncbi:unnamed protein product [Dovyalis caffra]|uniref:Uncharacterized protein n=1 Tax=Dovyalis caffra TaxID=77055 RepID=A0AAV1R0V2_9ROSI|nr:unnamed protein product [Dovyalis caffra]
MALTNNAKDHWAFLEEIEAPMWVDFMVESKSNYQEVFHECSSRQLKTAFAHSGERSMSSDLEFKGSSSPNIPSSVSRSRGKHYASKKWGEGNCDLLVNKQHPVKGLNGKSSRVNSEPSDEIKPKLSFVNSKGTSRSKVTKVSGSSFTQNAPRSKVSKVSGKNFTRNAKESDSKAKSGQGVMESSSNSLMVMAGESNNSNVKFESDHQARQRNLEVSSRGFDHTSGLLSALRNGLRKSFVTRKASRVEINDENKKPRDRKSSSSKSSVGASFNPGYDVKSSTLLLMRNNEQTPDSRNVGRMTEAARKRIKDSSMSKACNVQVMEKKGGLSNVAKSAPQEALKSKVQNQTRSVKALAEHRGNEQHLLPGTAKAKEKARVGAGPGKENVTGKTSLSQNCTSRGTKLNVPQKGDKKMLVRQKGTISGPAKGKHPTNANRRVCLR